MTVKEKKKKGGGLFLPHNMNIKRKNWEIKRYHNDKNLIYSKLFEGNGV